MDGVDLSSPSVGIGETDIHPWDLIRHGLSEELDTDPSLFHEVCTRAAQDLGPVFVQNVNNAEEFFAALQNNLSNDEVLMLDYLIALVGIVNLHSHQGSQPFKDVLLEYKKRLTKYREDYARVSQTRAEEFIGRTKDLKDVEKNLTGNQYQGVALCGMGGMGKTSLATEVCYTLLNAKKRWIVKKIDMREKEDLVDLLRDLVGEIGLDCNSTEIQDLYSELIHGLSGIKDRLIFFIDNLDDMMRTAAKKSELLKFLEHFCGNLKSLHTEVRLLVTLRQKLVLEETLTSQKIPRTAKRLSGVFFEVELQKLNQQDGKDLLKACCRRPLTASPDNEVCWKIVNFCGGSPLAIKTVGAAIRSGKVNPQMLAKKLEELPGLEIESQCLRQTFETMDKTKQEQLVKLHVFGTAKFDLAAAAFVLGEKSMSEETPIVFATTISMIYLKSRHFVEVDDLSRKETEDIKTTSKGTKFSLHPLVHKFLIQVADDKDFEKAVYEAKCLFIDYIEKKNSKIFESFERNCVEAWRELKDFKVHLKTYYDLIEKSSTEFWKMKTGTRSILTCKRISEVADLFLEDYYKYKLLKKYVEHSKARGNFLETALWQIHLGRKYFESDRNEIAEKMVIAILHDTLQNVKPDDEDLGSLVEVVGALFYLAGKLCLEERKYLEAMQYFQETKQLWANRLDKEMRKKYKIDLALVYNSLGKVYANLTPPNIQKSKYNHLKAFFIAYRISDNFNNIDIPLYIQNIGRCLYREGLELERRKDKRTANQCFRDAETYYRQAMKLFTHFKMEKFDSFAEVQRNLAFVEMKLGEMGLAEDDIVKTHELRKMIMCPPHEVVTLTMHDVGTVRAERAIFMYWDYFTNKIGDKYGALNKLYQAVADYEHVMHLMKRGGLPRNHPEYENIKNTDIWILKQVKENKKLAKAIQFYKEFERGKFEAAGKKARSEKATTKFSYTHEELQTMFAAGVFEGATIVKDSSSEESDDDSDANDGGVSRTSSSLGATSDDLVLNLRKTKLNFNYIFRECPPEEQLEFGDVTGDDYYIEEDFKGVNVLDNFNACENLMEEVKDIEENSDDEMEFTEGPMKILERRTSNISVSSQSSLEEEDVEARRKRFARKGSRESSLQEFLEDRLSESKTVAKNRHLSSSSISVEVSVDEDVVLPEAKVHPYMQRLKQFLHERFAAKDRKDLEKKAQQDVKQKRARMQKQPTITEEPMGPQNLADDTKPSSKKRK